MATVRRRVSPWLNEDGFAEMRVRIVELFDDGEHIDNRIGRFCDYFPVDKKHRWVRDLAVELLHNADPERMPMMNRWVWDAKANTGVIREIWHGENVDAMTIPVGDGYEGRAVLHRCLVRAGLCPVHLRTGRNLSAGRFFGA
jgi:hypothetical protein